MKSRKPFASLSLDLDNLWSYMKTHGDSGWHSFPSYLPTFIPSVLKLLREHEVRITFFVVGQDAALGKNREALQQLKSDGHEIGNHSFNHEPWISRYSKAEIDREIALSEEEIEHCTGMKPRGFRGPGFAWSPDLLEVLALRGYLYDASTLPTFLGPLARLYYFRSTKMDGPERDRRKELFGHARDGFRPATAFRWKLDSGNSILEIPVSTMPLFKIPFHLSYLIYLAGTSEALMVSYLRLALSLCRLTSAEPSFLLHPLDFLDAHEYSQLSFFPGMKISSERKNRIFTRVISILREHYDLVPLGVYAESLSGKAHLRELSARKEFRGSPGPLPDEFLRRVH
ncbi:MAG: polysaccharide deacetylase family protein [Acidobacteriia bacterium]|nr:polysaccharide deacetylase family protein [Terriglobia bacterium]